MVVMTNPKPVFACFTVFWAVGVLKLSRENLTEADLYIAVGLPLAWMTEQKVAYRE